MTVKIQIGPANHLARGRKRHDLDTDLPVFMNRAKSYRYLPVHCPAFETNRATLGEYQPHKRVDGKRSFDGDIVLNYFPAVITQTQWDEVRKSIANKTANYGSSLRNCGGRSSEKVTNLFTGLIFDSTLGGRSVVYHYKGRGANDSEYLVTSYKSGQPSNRMRYDHFEKAFLGFLELHKA